MMLISAIKKYTPASLKKIGHDFKKLFMDVYFTKSYAQEGEDLVLKRIFGEKKNGFYVDVGAHHPKRFSNTYIFYQQGWRGINIDAMPNSMQPFKKIRPRDINLEIPVSDKAEELTYYAFNDPALNGFSKDLTTSRSDISGYHIIFEKQLRTETLSQILDKYLPKNQSIDFLSIDVEGLDFAVLQSNDWKTYQPTIILVEVLGKTLEDVMKSPIIEFMKQQGYGVYAKTFNTVFFKRLEESNQC